MASKQALMGVGTPGAQAFLLGLDPPTTFPMAGTNQQTATLLTSNFVILQGGTGGARLPPAAAQGCVVIRSVVAGNLYPAPGESINGLAPNASISMTNGLRTVAWAQANGGWTTVP